MALTTYSELQATIADYLARPELTNQIKDFIRLGENRLRRDLRIREMLLVATTETVSGDSTVSLPDNFLQMRDLHLISNPIIVLEYLSPSNFYRNSFSTVGGKPNQYTTLATDIQLAPIPDSEYTVQMLYYAKPDYLSDTNTTNIFLESCVDALLYASLGEAEPYLMNDARLATWASMYDRAIASITTSDDAGEYAGSPLSMTVSKR